VTENDGVGWGGAERKDLVVITRAEMENREFRAYGQGWRDRGEHERRRAAGHGTRAADDGAKVLPFPPQGPGPVPPSDEPS